jgi:hypothetical protein
MPISQLQAQRAALQAAFFQGVLTVRAGDKLVTYKSNAEMRDALAALDEQIAVAEGRKRVKRLLSYTTKGL